MPKHAKDGMLLEDLIALAIPACQQAQRLHPRTGPGAKPQIPDWVLTVMILVGVLLRKKTKTDQYLYWLGQQRLFARCFPRQRFPGRSTFFERYRRVHGLVQAAIGLQGDHAVELGLADAPCVAADKSLIHGRGRRCNSTQRCGRRVPCSRPLAEINSLVAMREHKTQPRQTTSPRQLLSHGRGQTEASLLAATVILAEFAVVLAQIDSQNGFHDMPPQLKGLGKLFR